MKSSNTIFLLTVFITGAAVLILEVAAVRLLSPIFGSSLHVLSSVLTVILLALSIGYWYGGKKSDKDTSLSYLFTVIIFSGISVLLLLNINKFILSQYNEKVSIISGPLIFSLILFFLPAFLLGIVSPYIIKIQALNITENKIGSVVGSTFFLGYFRQYHR